MYIHTLCDIGNGPTHEEIYAMCIERTKPSGGENRSPTTQRLHAAETISSYDDISETMYLVMNL